MLAWIDTVSRNIMHKTQTNTISVEVYVYITRDY